MWWYWKQDLPVVGGDVAATPGRSEHVAAGMAWAAAVPYLSSFFMGKKSV